MPYKRVNTSFGDFVKRFGLKGWSDDVDWEKVYTVLNERRVGNLRIALPNPEGREGVMEARRIEVCPVFEVTYHPTEGEFETYPEIITASFYKSVEGIEVKRRLKVEGKSVEYSIVITEGNVSMSLPKMLREPDSVVDGYHYYSASGDEKDNLYRIGMALVDDAVRRCHFFREAKRYNDRCVTNVCFEKYWVGFDEEGKKKIPVMLRNAFQQEGTSVCLRKRDSWGRSTVRMDIEPGLVEARFAMSYRYGAAKSIGDFLRTFNIEIPYEAGTEFGERYTTWLAQQRKKLFEWIDDSIDWVGGGVSSAWDALGMPRPLRRYRKRRKEEERRLEGWLREDVGIGPNVDPNSCLVVVDRVCEVSVRKGERLEPEDKVERVGVAEAGDQSEG